MIIIYDFDGTLTPYPLAQYAIYKKCGYTSDKIYNIVLNEMKKNKSLSLYDAYYKCYTSMFPEKGIPMTRENVCLGAREVELNNGVLEYFQKFQSSKTGIKHYIVTSGVQYFVEETPINKFLDGVYGVTFTKKDNVYENIDIFLNDKKKIDVIKKICDDNNEKEKVIYFGDGLTDKYAFEYVHSIGGKNIFVMSNEENVKKFKEIDTDKIIDEYFEPDFSNGSSISNYVNKLII